MATLLSSTLCSSSHLLLRKNPYPYPRPLHPVSISFPLRPSLARSSLAISASLLSPPPPLLSTSTRTVTSLLSVVFSFSRSVAASLASASSSAPLFASTSSLFFARSSSSLNTPMTVVAAGMAKWLDLYSGVLMVRVLLSWFPNIPWDRQPLSAIRDLCDPYLSLFRNIIPPVFDTLDVSPLLAFAVLGVLSSIVTAAVH